MSHSSTRFLHAAGLAIGMGMGGFVDGILFHQIFQFHNMLSARISTDTLVGAKVNMVWDGFFLSFIGLVSYCNRYMAAVEGSDIAGPERVWQSFGRVYANGVGLIQCGRRDR